jgi:hypothetical protein
MFRYILITDQGRRHAIQTHVDNDFKRKLIDFCDGVKHPDCKIDVKIDS